MTGADQEKWLLDLNHVALAAHKRRGEQLAKWGTQQHDHGKWWEILMEEVEELRVEMFTAAAPEDVEKCRQRIVDEALDVAAVAMAIAQYAQTGEA